MIDKVKEIFMWRSVRKLLILRKHYKCAKYCNELIDDYYNTSLNFNKTLNAKKTNLIGKKIIWQYWGQGYERNQLPELIQMCLQSIEENCEDDCLIIRLNDETISDYIDLPDFVNDNRILYTKAHFSDILRLCLLVVYGGCWLDATVLLTGAIPTQYWHYPYFLYQRHPQEANKDYWEKTYAYYFGWDSKFKVRVLNSIIFSQPRNKIITDWCNLMLKFWQTGKSYPDYFFSQIMFNELIGRKNIMENCEIVSDCLPHYLQQYINDKRFNFISKDEIVKNTIHKLSYKTNDVGEKIAEILNYAKARLSDNCS